MKDGRESVFKSSVRAFFISFFAVVGIAAAVLAVSLGLYGLIKVVEEESLPEKVKVLSDAEGNRARLSSSAPVLLQISMCGTIGEEKITGKNINDILLDTQEDVLKGRVKGILLVIDSPGGGANESDIIYHLLKDYKQKYHVPIYAFVDGLCASGGYYIACAADKIYATHVSLIGSIGALSWPPYMNVSDALEKIGVNSITLSAGTGKDQLNPFRTWKPDEQQHRQELINFLYNTFVDIVSNERQINREVLVQEYGAKVYAAPDAVTLGLIDGHGYSRSDAITALAHAAKVKQEYQVVGFETESWWKKLMQEDSCSPLLTGKIKHELPLPIHNSYPFSYLYIP